MEEIRKCEKFIKACSLFDGIDMTGVNMVYAAYKRGETITDMIDGRQYVGVIGSGKADVYTLSDELSQPNVSTQEAGSVFGICNVYLKHNMPTKLVCKVGCEVVFIPKEEFKQLVETSEEFRDRYLLLCNQKIIYLAQKIELMGITQSSSRFACYLLKNRDERDVVMLHTSKEQFARFLSMSRATLFRVIAEFEEKGYVRTAGNKFQILQPEIIQKISEGK